MRISEAQIVIEMIKFSGIHDDSSLCPQMDPTLVFSRPEQPEPPACEMFSKHVGSSAALPAEAPSQLRRLVYKQDWSWSPWTS
ncbi:hypothetical protein CRENBAI_009933 [Crenichthys baileyi]|uniref:Uncharacterized protein n=1 Tax=Crenichthys baileyi TaxID=28760 RepID=A0AAV9SKI6_9TELE